MTKFVKGQIANPLGAGAHNKVKKALKRMITNNFFCDIIDALMSGNMESLSKIANDPNSSALKVGVARAIFTAAKKGDWATLQSIIERIVGKVPERIETENTIITMSDEQRQKRIAQLLNQIKHTDHES